ncbi:MAG: hypothetical protein HYV97_04955 [Bdellovibrio sp.]|nr:hypothetical protein [Bdellovibrio sp.]
MKIIIAALLLVSSLATLSAEVHSMKCTMESYYLNFTKDIVIDLKNPDFLGNGPTQNGVEWEIAWSQTECEDSTSLFFDLKEYKKFLERKEKSIFGRLEHSEPAMTINAEVECQAI